jgi:hypothetical protein
MSNVVPFHQRNFSDRLTTMGDPAEEACDLVYGHRTHALGFNRVWQNGVGLTMSQMTASMRYTPDRLTINAFVECMGIGRDKTLKIKTEKVHALQAWAMLGPTKLFVFDQPKNAYHVAEIDDWEEACLEHAELKMFPEGKEYWALHRDHFPSFGHAVPLAMEEAA